MAFFDMNCCFGRSARGGKGWDSLDAFSEALNALGITGGLVAHQGAVEADILRGNEAITRTLADHPDFFPCWVMAPASLGDLPAPHHWVYDAQMAGVRAVRLCPRHSLYTLDEWNIAPLFEALDAAHLPVLIDYGPHHWTDQPVAWEALARLCTRFPALPIILLNATPGEMRALGGLMHHAPNLHVEMHALPLPDLLPRFENRGWINRLLFGSGLPAGAAECPLHQLRNAEVRSEALQAVAWENAQRILGITPKHRVAPAPPASIYARSEIIDIHGHCGAWNRLQCLFSEPHDFKVEMKRCGVGTLVLSSFSALHGEREGGNAEMLEFIATLPEKLRGYFVADPHAPKASLKQAQACFAQHPEVIGLKLHCELHGAPLHTPGYAPVLDYANEQGLPVLVHVHGEEDWPGVAHRYPNARFILAHACLWDGVNPDALAPWEWAATLPNLYVDLSGSGCHAGALRALIDRLGANKILFGSDFPLFDFAWAIGRVRQAAITADEQHALLRQNALRIMPRLRQAARPAAVPG